MFQTRGFIFRKTFVYSYTDMVWYVLHDISINSLVVEQCVVEVCVRDTLLKHTLLEDIKN
jgi:hypothetical protein